MNAGELRNALVRVLSGCDKIVGVGQTGDANAPLIPGNSDIDLFVLCTEVPSAQERQSLYGALGGGFSLQMEVCGGGIWGYGDILLADGIDVMPMYFTVQEMADYIDEVLDCRHLYKDGRFYPVGRLASVAGINVLYEQDGAWTTLVNKVNAKPVAFFKAWFDFEIGQVLDGEDLGRSLLRREVLFFHQVLENALDHLLQALYAANRRYFPSRKRTLADIEGFAHAPAHCGARLLAMVANGAGSDTIAAAVDELRAMTAEVAELGRLSLRTE